MITCDFIEKIALNKLEKNIVLIFIYKIN